MRKFIACLIALVTASLGYAGPYSATAVLNGGAFLQGGSLTNNSNAGHNITSFAYSLGTPANNVATWDTGTGGGTASDSLSNPRWFQTVTWTGLNITPGGTFNFSGLDIDLIATLSPLSIDEGTIDNGGTSLRNAFVRVTFNDGTTSFAKLNQTGWTVSQTLNLEPLATPEPISLVVFGGLLVGGGLIARRRLMTKVAA